jgi:hypothetical protein
MVFPQADQTLQLLIVDPCWLFFVLGKGVTRIR